MHSRGFLIMVQPKINFFRYTHGPRSARPPTTTGGSCQGFFLINRTCFLPPELDMGGHVCMVSMQWVLDMWWWVCMVWVCDSAWHWYGPVYPGLHDSAWHVVIRVHWHEYDSAWHSMKHEHVFVLHAYLLVKLRSWVLRHPLEQWRYGQWQVHQSYRLSSWTFECLHCVGSKAYW